MSAWEDGVDRLILHCENCRWYKPGVGGGVKDSTFSLKKQ